MTGCVLRAPVVASSSQSLIWPRWLPAWFGTMEAALGRYLLVIDRLYNKCIGVRPAGIPKRVFFFSIPLCLTSRGHVPGLVGGCDSLLDLAWWP